MSNPTDSDGLLRPEYVNVPTGTVDKNQDDCSTPPPRPPKKKSVSQSPALQMSRPCNGKKSENCDAAMVNGVKHDLSVGEAASPESNKSEFRTEALTTIHVTPPSPTTPDPGDINDYKILPPIALPALKPKKLLETKPEKQDVKARVDIYDVPDLPRPSTNTTPECSRRNPVNNEPDHETEVPEEAPPSEVERSENPESAKSRCLNSIIRFLGRIFGF